MNIEIRQIADRLQTALENLGIKAKRTHLYDLIAAARGLRNRELLKQAYVMPNEADREAIGIVASKITKDDAEQIIACTAAIAMPTPLNCILSEGWKTVSFDILFEELEDVGAFLSGPRADEAIKTIARDMYFSKYYLDRGDSGMDLQTANKVGAEILESGCRYSALEKYYGDGQSAYDAVEDNNKDIDDAITALRGLADEHGANFDEDEWVEALKEAIQEHLEDEDDSSIMDMVQDSDRVEVMFLFAPKEGYLDDVMIHGHYRYCDPDKVRIDHPLQFALARLGYSIGEFRRFTGNQEEAQDDLDPGLQPASRALISPGKLCSLIENASDSYFHIGLYLQIPLKELMEIDTTQSITLRNAHICTYGMINGTFHDEVKIPEITLHPHEGRFICIGDRYSPSDICGLHNPPYHGSAVNVPQEEGENIQIAFQSEADEQFSLKFAA